MTLTTTELLDYLRKLDIEITTHEHEHVRTVQEAQALRGNIPGAHTKNLFLRDAKRRFFLLVVEEGAKIDLKSLGGKIGASGKLSFASPDHLQEILGVQPGAVSVLALINDSDKRATLVMDHQLSLEPIINCHPLSSAYTATISKADLEKFLNAIGQIPIFITLD